MNPTQSTPLLERYRKQHLRSILLILGGGILTLVLGVGFAALGTTDTTFSDIWQTIWQFLLGKPLDTAQKVILHLRLPRVVMAILCGIGLSISGTAMQGITGNPLVSPCTIGISNAAAFGASLAIVFQIGILPQTDTGIVLTAFFMAFVCAIVVWMVSSRTGMQPETVILTGIAINYLFSAATSVIQYFADEHRLSAAVAWAFGSLNGAKWGQIGIMAGLVLPCFLILFLLSPALNILSGGDDEVASSLGIHPARIRILVGAASVLATAAVVSFCGVIGFVGLAAPHIARLVIGNDHRFSLPFSAVTGAILLLVSDTIGRLILSPILIPVGIIISFLGVPIFVNLILTRRKGRSA